MGSARTCNGVLSHIRFLFCTNLSSSNGPDNHETKIFALLIPPLSAILSKIKHYFFSHVGLKFNIKKKKIKTKKIIHNTKNYITWFFSEQFEKLKKNSDAWNFFYERQP